MKVKRKYRARWCLHPPAEAEVDDGPDWMAADYETLEVALFAARYHGRHGPAPGGWSVEELKWSPARDLRRQGRWIPTGRAWNAQTGERGEA